MNRARVLTPWKGTGTATDPRRPALADDHPVLACVDVTGQPAASLTPAPNVYTVEILCDDATLGALVNDPRYGPGILWSSSI